MRLQLLGKSGSMNDRFEKDLLLNITECGSFEVLQEEALFNAPEYEPQNISSASKEHAQEFTKKADIGDDGHSFV